ncbi:hypothetical protein F5Y16DRAFT_422373 [Xylariaceae sp. FL0255]|nr:hypothetical protein F5Y16DRAFT_422373 [Xylariaceae sp. FL0255]
MEAISPSFRSPIAVLETVTHGKDERNLTGTGLTCELILERSSESQLLARPSLLDEELSGQPPAFMAQAISTSAHKLSGLIVKKVRTVMQQEVPQLPFLRRFKGSQSYTSIARSCALDTDSARIPSHLKLLDYIFFIGTTSNCRILQTLKIRQTRWSGTTDAQLPPNGALETRQGGLELAGLPPHCK